jgi:Uma2 family endonuclease
MTRPIDTHIGPWTLADLLDLPDDDNRYEILEEVLHVSPPAVPRHHLVAKRLEVALDRASPPGVEAFTGGVGVAAGASFVIPDVVVTRTDAMAAADHLTPADVLLAVEVESPGSVRRDRVFKPRVLARHGIPAYWRVEMGDEMTIVVYTLGEGVYVETARAVGEQTLRVTRPLTVILRPADLDRQAGPGPGVATGDPPG